MNKVEKHFDKWAESYDWYLKVNPVYAKLVEKLVESMNLEKGSTLLDIGIGTGNVALKMIDKYDCKVVGIDVSAEMIDRCRNNFKDRGIDIVIKKESLESTSLPDNTYDAAIAAYAVHHITDENKSVAFKELNRVMKKGGKVGIAEATVDIEGDLDSNERLAHIIDRWGKAAQIANKHGGPKAAAPELEAIRTVYMRDGEYLLSKDGWCKLLEDAGFCVLSAECVNEELGQWVIIGEKK